jgi:hypothetical protein
MASSSQEDSSDEEWGQPLDEEEVRENGQATAQKRHAPLVSASIFFSLVGI